MEATLKYTVLYNVIKSDKRNRVFFTNQVDAILLADRMREIDVLFDRLGYQPQMFVPTIRPFDESDKMFV